MSTSNLTLYVKDVHHREHYLNPAHIVEISFMTEAAQRADGEYGQPAQPEQRAARIITVAAGASGANTIEVRGEQAEKLEKDLQTLQERITKAIDAPGFGRARG